MWWAAAKGRTCIALDIETIQCMTERTNELASHLNGRHVQMLKWSDVLLRVAHGDATKERMRVDILRSLHRMAPSSRMDTAAILGLSPAPPTEDSSGVRHAKNSACQELSLRRAQKSASHELSFVPDDDVVYDASADVDEHTQEYECYAQVGPFSTEKAWLPG